MVTAKLRRMMVIANTDWFIANFMMPFLSAHTQAGIEVIAGSPAGKYAPRLAQAGIHWVEVPMSRGRGSIRSNQSTLTSIRGVIRDEEPDLIHLVTAKSVVLGNMALSREASTAVINVLPGLGHAFAASGLQARLDSYILQWGARKASNRWRSFLVFHQNADLEKMLGREARGHRRTAVIPGWGVDLARFTPAGAPEVPPLVALIGRMLWSKGVEDFVKAAQLCRDSVDARFVLVGDPDLGNPSPIPEARLEAWSRSGHVEWWRHRDDIPDVLSRASLVVLPSRYGEGVPQALIEAAAMRVPIVASDVPGCREVVEDGRNGFLVPPGDVYRLADAMLRLLRDPQLRRQMGAQGRELAEHRFAVHEILTRYEKVYRDMGFEIRFG